MPAPIAEEIKENLKKAEEALEEGMALCEAKAQLALIAFKDGWNVAKKFADEPVTKKLRGSGEALQEGQARRPRARKPLLLMLTIERPATAGRHVEAGGPSNFISPLLSLGTISGPKEAKEKEGMACPLFASYVDDPAICRLGALSAQKGIRL
ncbi:hypothetical protein CYMTET_16662 [Cymbomonas tetramitiformis]|uniref:Uncharacterized protein n=1 Tax=Cymbomonas tetramitiformis TaxID=36881 RepID=A0AAE0GBQ4_9CHLO|nr:hypothetical protein CYMTET_16662 [Cymbomonas tetramitiformis]